MGDIIFSDDVSSLLIFQKPSSTAIVQTLMDASLFRKLIVEFIGTFFLVYVVGCVSLQERVLLHGFECSDGPGHFRQFVLWARYWVHRIRSSRCCRKYFGGRFQPSRGNCRSVLGAREWIESLDVLAQRVSGCRCRSGPLSRT